MDEQCIPPVTIIGMGGIGTGLLPVLTRLPFEGVTIYDDDGISRENLINQLFWTDADIDKEKASVAAELLERSGRSATSFPIRYTGEKLFDKVVIAAVDLLESRRTIWRGVQESEGRVELLIDGRLSRENPYFFQLFTIQTSNREDCEAYEDWLAGNEGTDTGRRNPDMVSATLVLSGLIAQIIMQWNRGERLPWQTVWDGVGMSLTSF